MSDPNLVNRGEKGASESQRPRWRHLRLLIAAGAVMLVATVVMVVALMDENGDPRAPGEVADRKAPAPGASQPGAGGEKARTKLSSAPAPVPVPSDGGGKRDGGEPRDAKGDRAPVAVAEPPAKPPHPDAGPSHAPPSATAGPSHAAKPVAPHAEGGAGGGPAPVDAGVRPADRKPAAESTRRASGKDGIWDSRDDDGDFVLVARFVPTGGAFLTGRVLDADTGRPVAGTGIEARRAKQYMTGTTDGAGVFRMAGMLPGSRVVVWVGGKHDAFVAERIDVAIPGEGQVADAGAVRLLRGDELGPHLEGWVGLFVARRSGHLLVSAVSPWLPADRAGLQVGDFVVSIDGRDVTGFGPRAATFLLRGPPGSSATLVTEDHAGTRHKLTLQRIHR